MRQPQLRSSAPDYCSHFTSGYCTGPSCVEAAYLAVTPDRLRDSQRRLESQARPAPHEPTLGDLRDGAPLTEAALCHVLINYLILEDQARTLSALDIDCFAVCAGDYPDSASDALGEIFAEWNRRVGREYFTLRRNLLAAA